MQVAGEGLICHLSTHVCKHYSNELCKLQIARSATDGKCPRLSAASTYFLSHFFFRPTNSVFVIIWRARENFIVRSQKHHGYRRPVRQPPPPPYTDD
jgi:hypothetical protein